MCWEHPIAFTVFIQCFLDLSPPSSRNDWTESSSVSVLPSWSFLAGCKVLNFHRCPLSAHSLPFTDSCTMLSTIVTFLAFLCRDAGRLINSMRYSCTIIYHLHWPSYNLALKRRATQRAMQYKQRSQAEALTDRHGALDQTKKKVPFVSSDLVEKSITHLLITWLTLPEGWILHYINIMLNIRINAE